MRAAFFLHVAFPALTLLCPMIASAGTAPSFRTNDTILFVGDSITDGGRARTGNDYNHTMGQGYAYILSAKLGNDLAEKNLTFINRGIGSEGIADLQRRWQQDVIALKPDLLSILIGINDTHFKHVTVEQYEQTYDQLLRETLAALPGVRIVLGEPFMLPAGKWKEGYPGYLAELRKRQAVVARLAEKYHLPVVRYQEAFDEACKRAPADHWIWDGIHPHYAGHDLMAQEWLKTCAGFWP